MQIVVDTNILIRCSRGRAMRHVVALKRDGVRLATTAHNEIEMLDVLIRRFAMDGTEAAAAVDDVLRPFDILRTDAYEGKRGEAEQRLRAGGTSDWPALAAALSLKCDIWSEDVDFFGTGVAVWTTANTPRIVITDRDLSIDG